ncbi:MAG: VOC family protein [Anaerolineaceae bacterium]|nr:VOC family protein [Anaerolineaceae bacterium]
MTAQTHHSTSSTLVMLPCGRQGTTLLLAKASTPQEEKSIGNQSGGRVFLFLSTDDFWRNYHEMVQKGVKFIRDLLQTEYGTVAVFKDLYGNRWDLVQHIQGHAVNLRFFS